MDFSINDTDSDSDGYQRTVNGDDECEKFDRGTVREIYQDVSLCSQQADVVCLSKKVENLGEIPRKNTPSAIRTDTHDDLTSQEQCLRDNHARTERAQRLIDKI